MKPIKIILPVLFCSLLTTGLFAQTAPGVNKAPNYWYVEANRSPVLKGEPATVFSIVFEADNGNREAIMNQFTDQLKITFPKTWSFYATSISPKGFNSMADGQAALRHEEANLSQTSMSYQEILFTYYKR